MEALLDVLVDPKGDGKFKKTGDVIVAQLPRSRWGNEEKKTLQIVEFPPAGSSDDLIDWCSKIREQLLSIRESTGDPNPSISYPFCEVATEEGTTPMTSRSAVRVDLEQLPDEILREVTNRSMEAQKLTCAATRVIEDQTGQDNRPYTDTVTVASRRPTGG